MSRTYGLTGSKLALAMAAVTALPAQAVDFDGYFRAGPGATSKGNARACYNLNGTGVSGAGTHYRLGNECDFYGEFGLAQTGTVEGVTYKAKVMFNESNPGTDIGDSKSSFNQMYVEGKGFDIAPNVNFWVGKRFYGRADVHILDYKFVQLDGVGAGADSIGVGGGQLAVAAVRPGVGRHEPELRQPDGGIGHQELSCGREPDLAAGRVRRPGRRPVGDQQGWHHQPEDGHDLGGGTRLVCGGQELQAGRRGGLFGEEARGRAHAEAGQVHLRAHAVDRPGLLEPAGIAPVRDHGQVEQRGQRR